MSECTGCGVAFNTGSRKCEEADCPKAQAGRNRYKYPKTIDPIATRLNSCRIRARNRGMGFDLTYHFVVVTLKQPCIYCGGKGYIQLDRRDNEIGYLQSNVVPACARCNEVKGRHLTYEQMVLVVHTLGWAA